MDQFLPDFKADPSKGWLLFDIYYDILGILVLLLLATVLWIIINIALTLRDVSSNYHDLSVNTSIFSLKSKLRPVRDSIMKVLAYYFIGISLIVLSYVNYSEYTREIAILLIFLFMGGAFFIVGFESISRLLNGQVEIEQDEINKRNAEYIQELTGITPENRSKKIEEINQISTMLDILQKQREVLGKINTRVYDLRSILSFLGVSFLPIITDILKNLKPVLTNIITQGVMLINSTFPKS